MIHDELTDGGIHGQLSENYIWTKRIVGKEALKSLLVNSNLLDLPRSADYDTFLDDVFGAYVVVGSLERLQQLMIENPRQFVAAYGVPSSHLIGEPTKGGELTYNRNIHFVLNVKAKLNYGKQNITNTRLLGRINDFYTDAYRATLKNVAKAIVGVQTTGGSSGGYASSLENPDRNILDRPDLGISDFSLRKEPRDENAVIGIFYELIGRGYLKGYETYSLHRTAKYDGRAMIKHSGQAQVPRPHTDSDLAVVEFKLRTSELINDFEEETKIPAELVLFVTWENDFENSQDFQVVNIENTVDVDRRFDKVTMCVQHRLTGRTIQMLVLKDVIEEIRAKRRT